MGRKFKVTVNGEVFDVEIEEVSGSKVANVPSSSVPSTTKSEKKTVSVSSSSDNKTVPEVKPEKKEPKKEVNTKGKKVVVAPLPGKILSVNVKKGDFVKKGDLLLVIEAMKMENEIFASQDGTVTDVLVNTGDYVSTGDKLVIME